MGRKPLVRFVALRQGNTAHVIATAKSGEQIDFSIPSDALEALATIAEWTNSEMKETEL